MPLITASLYVVLKLKLGIILVFILTDQHTDSVLALAYSPHNITSKNIMGTTKLARKIKYC